MSDSMLDRLDDQESVTITEALDIPQPRAVGSPLPRGNGSRVPLPASYAELEELRPAPHPGPVLASAPAFPSHPGPVLATPAAQPIPESAPLPITFAPEPAPSPEPLPARPAVSSTVPASASTPSSAPARTSEPPRSLQTRSSEPPSTLQRAVGVIRQAIPIVQKLLPLLEGNVAATVSNLLKPPPPPQPVAPQARVDLAPLKQNIVELQSMHRDLREQITEQNTSLKRVEDQLEMVREATDRNTLEQQELLEDLKAMGSKVNVVAAVAIGLLAISLLVNMALYMHIQRVLP